MAIRLEFHNLVIRRDRLEALYPGGWKGFLDYWGDDTGLTVWFDDYLVRFGAMNARDLQDTVRYWEGQGLRLVRRYRGSKQSADMCVVSAYGPDNALPCRWLRISDGPEGLSARFAGRRRR